MRYLTLLIAASLLSAQTPDLFIANRIKAESFRNSQVMETAFYLTDVYGPRLTGSPQLKQAAEWVVKRMAQWGITEPRLESWGPFGRGWTNLRFHADLKSPQPAALIGFARPWSPGTKGPVTGEPILAPIRSEADFSKFRGKLKGKIVMLGDARVLLPQNALLFHRYDDPELAKLGLAPDPAPPRPAPDPETRRRFRNALNKFLNDEGVILTIVPSFKRDSSTVQDLNLLADGGTIFGTQAGSPNPADPVPPPSIALSTEHYDRLARLVEHKLAPIIEIDVENKFLDDSKDAFNVLGEIPGDSKKDEVVMVGAHLDSWSFATGATDNAAGCAAALEAVRILKALNLKMARTVRIGLWTGEEQGLLGSRAYIKKHFADRQTMELKPEHAKISGYFNLDNGTGKVRGVYLQGNDMMRPVFESWLSPFRDLGVTTVSIRETAGTDHLSFDEVGIPGFQFIQDPVEYETRTHHSNMDTYDRLQAPDLMQAAAVLATVLYDAATREERLPRKPLPKPQPARQGGARSNATE